MKSQKEKVREPGGVIKSDGLSWVIPDRMVNVGFSEVPDV